MIVDADDVAGAGCFRMLPICGEKSDGLRNLHLLAKPHMLHTHAFAVLTRDNTHEGDAIPVSGIHICLDLEDEARQLVLERRDIALFAFVGLG